MTKLVDTLINKMGEERYRKWVSERGRAGGLVKNPNKGFGSDPERASLAGRKSKRVKVEVRDGNQTT